MMSRLSSGIRFGWTVAALLGGVAVAVTMLCQGQQQEAQRWVDHTLEVLGRVRALQTTLHDISGDARNFILSRQPSWLPAYRQLVAQAHDDVQGLKAFTADNPSQEVRLASIEERLDRLAGWFDYVIASARSKGFPAALAELASGRGQAEEALLDADIDQMVSQEEGLLRARQFRAAKLWRLAVWVDGALLVLVALQLVGSALSFRTQYRSLRRERALVDEARRYFEAIVATVREALLVVDGTLRVRSANAAYYAIFRTTAAQTEGRHLAEIGDGLWNHADLLERIRKLMAADGEIQNYRMEQTDGDRRRTLVLGARPVYRPGEAEPLVLLAIVDETERERAEARLRESNAELESFAYSVAHDLRAPLRGMKGFSEALLEDFRDALGVVGGGYARNISESASRMDRLIGDLLEYARLARTEFEPAPVALDEVVVAARDQVRSALAEARATVRVDEPLPAVLGHFGTLVQVVANLLGNGAKFVPAGAAPEIRIRAEQRGSVIRTWVEDNGIGIAPEHHERIFAVFERLHGQGAFPGTGIGLAIVRKGIERMGGRVGLESEAGAGARFWFELPAAVGAR